MPSSNRKKRAEIVNRRVSQVSARLFGVNKFSPEAANQDCSDIHVMTNFDNASFAEHCFDHFGVDTLEAMLLEEPDPSVLCRWDLDADQWRQQIRYAIQMIRRD